MTRAQEKKLDHVETMLDFLVNKMTVNGEDGTAIVVGVENILNHEHKLNKIQSRQIGELVDLTGGLKAKKKLRESFQTYLDSHGFVKFLLTPNKVKVAIGLALIILVSESFGFQGISHLVSAVLKLMGWIK